MKKRGYLVGIVLLILVAGGLLNSPLLSKHPETAQIRVGVVIQGGDQTSTYCVTLPEGATGYDALLATGVPVAVSASPQGVAICQIGEIGCPANDCFCQCQGSRCLYWAYFHQEDQGWTFSSIGAGGYRLQNGAVEGWRWGEGDPPPLMPFAQICGPLDSE